jgi:hypothetical protein
MGLPKMAQNRDRLHLNASKHPNQIVHAIYTINRDVIACFNAIVTQELRRLTHKRKKF